MNISKTNAMQIVTEISAIIDQNVNLMDERGVIIASTDPARLYSFHGGAAHVIENGLRELIITRDDEYVGTRKGINLPLELDGGIVGVVGLTGEYDEVVKYGQIIKKMTEILVRENYEAQQKKLDGRIQERFMHDWVLDGLPLTPELVERGRRLGIDVTRPYRVMAAEIADLPRHQDTAAGQMLIDRVNRYVRKNTTGRRGGLFTKTTSRMVMLVPDVSCTTEKLAELADGLREDVKQEFGVELLIGIDERCDRVGTAYQRAAKALGACNMVRGRPVCKYASIHLELFTGEVSAKAKREYVLRIFHPLPYEQVGGWVHLLEVYYRCDRSLAKAGEALFLHKNTLQYRLAKLHTLTGLDPRYIYDAALFILAIELYADLQKQEEA